MSFELMESAEAVYVTSIDEENFPQTRVMFNLRNKDQFPALHNMFQGNEEDLLVYLSTNTSSSKVAQIRANPVVSAFFCKPKEFHSLMLAGQAEIITDKKIKKALWQDDWEIYYPSGPDGPDYTILRLFPIKAKGWYKDQPFEFRQELGK